jgi:hypothetical protein
VTPAIPVPPASLLVPAGSSAGEPIVA